MRFSTLLWLVPVMVQIALDPVLIFGLHLGVEGAALSIIGGQAVSAAMSVWFFFLRHDRPYRITLADLLPHAPTVRSLLGIGAPSFLTGIGATVLAVLVNSTLAHAGAATALAAYAVCTRIRTFITTPQLGISQGLQPVVGYSYGRAQPERARRAMTLALRATVLYGILVLAFVILLARPMVAIFVTDPSIASTAQHALRIIALAFAAYGITPLISAYFQSVGKPKPSYLLSLGTLLAVKIPLVIVLGRTGINGIWIGLAVGELASALIAMIILELMDPHSRVRDDRETPGDWREVRLEDVTPPDCARSGQGRRRTSRGRAPAGWAGGRSGIAPGQARPGPAGSWRALPCAPRWGRRRGPACSR